MQLIKVISTLILISLISFNCGDAGDPPGPRKERNTSNSNLERVSNTEDVTETVTRDAIIEVKELIDIPATLNWLYANINNKQENVVVISHFSKGNLKIIFDYKGIYFYTEYKLQDWEHIINVANGMTYRFLKSSATDIAGNTYNVRFTTNFNTGEVISLEVGNIMFSNTRKTTLAVDKPQLNYDDFHIVKTGENLNLIAAKYGITLDDLIKMNPKFKTNRTVMVGENIKLK
jgi:LysM repeat protein